MAEARVAPTVIISIELQFGALRGDASAASARGTSSTEYNLIHPPVLAFILLFFPGRFEVPSLPFLLPNCSPASFRAGARASPQLHYSPSYPPRKKKLSTIHRPRPRSRQQGEPGRARSGNRPLESRSIFRSRLHQLRPPCRSRSHLTALPRTRIPANPGGGRGFFFSAGLDFS